MKNIQLIEITEKAAINCYGVLGKGDKNLIDQKAVDQMKIELDKMNCGFKICSGEGAIDEAPELISEEGLNNDQLLDIIVDPIEGTTLAASNFNNAITVMGIGTAGSFRCVPDMYAKKIFSPHNISDKVTINSSLIDIINEITRFTAKEVQDVVVAVLDKPRHQQLIEELIEIGVSVFKIPDGDVLVSLQMYKDKKYDLFYSIGGTPEGLLNAAIINHMNGYFQMQLIPMEQIKCGSEIRSIELEKEECECCDIHVNQIFHMNDLILSDDYAIIATGVTDGMLLEGVKKVEKNKFKTNSIYIDNESYREIDSLIKFK